MLADEERMHILRRFFSIHHGNVIHRYQEYRRLLQLAMATGDRHELLSDDYFVDLALWFNLAWIDPDDIRADQRLVELADKGARFTRDDVRYVIGRQRFMASGVPHLYHRLERDGSSGHCPRRVVNRERHHAGNGSAQCAPAPRHCDSLHEKSASLFSSLFR